MNIDFSDIEEVSNTPVDDDIVEASGSALATVNQDPVNVIANTEEVKDENTPLTPGSIELLPDMDVKVTVISDKAAKVIDLKKVDEMIAGESVMSSQLASYANEALDNRLFDHIPKASFTVTPTKTNLSAVQKLVKNSLAREEAELRSQYNDFLLELLDCIKDTAEEQEELYLNKLSESLALIVGTATQQYEKIFEYKDTVLPFTENRFIDIAKIHICDLKPSEIKIEGKDFTKYGKYIDGISAILKDRRYVSLIHSVNEDMNTSEAYEQGDVQVSEGSDSYIGDKIVTIEDLCKFSKKFMYSSVIEDLYSKIRDSKNHIESLLNRGKAVSEGENLATFIADNAKILTEEIDSIKCGFDKLTKTSLLIVTFSQFIKIFEDL